MAGARQSAGMADASTRIRTGSTPIAGFGGPRRVAVLGYDGFEPLDAVGPLDIFASCNFDASGGRADRQIYDTMFVAPEAGLVRSFFGLGLEAERGIAEVDPATLDTLIVAGGSGIAAARQNRALLDWLRAAHGKVRRLCSVCTGALLMAEAGLLDGRRAVTHWRWCETLRRDFPAVEVDPDPIWIKDGDIYTSAGVTAGMDLALALVEEDCGRRMALAIARAKVMFLKRPGGQAQFSAYLQNQLADAPTFADLRHWVLANPAADLTVPALAERAALSPRHFARLFLAETGQTPARFVEEVRLDAARRRLEDGAEGVERIAYDCGFGNAERMRRSFLRRLGVSPNDYRRRFRQSDGGAAHMEDER